MQNQEERIKYTTFYRVFRLRFIAALNVGERETSPEGPPEDGKTTFENPSGVTAAPPLPAEQGYIQTHTPHVRRPDENVYVNRFLGPFFLLNDRRGI